MRGTETRVTDLAQPDLISWIILKSDNSNTSHVPYFATSLNLESRGCAIGGTVAAGPLLSVVIGTCLGGHVSCCCGRSFSTT